jgi:hypothetical protein
MITIELPPDIEKQFFDVVRDSYDGNSQAAISTLLALHRKYGWKEQLRKDVESVRSEVRRQGGIDSITIKDAIDKYRISVDSADALWS